MTLFISRNLKETMIKVKTNMYEEKIEQMRAYHLEEIQDIKNVKLTSICFVYLKFLEIF